MQKQHLFRNTGLPLEKRIQDLVGRMTTEEKIAYLMMDQPVIERLDIPRYYFGHECLHGVARAGVATVFPQAIGLAACFDPGLISRIASAIGDEARAKRKAHREVGFREYYSGLEFFSPNINIFRDPRWGRGQETYGEDPYLTARMAVAFVNALQKEEGGILKAAACAKHFAVHSGPDPERHTINPEPSKKDLFETYLPAFEALVRQTDVQMVMATYNRLYGLSCCANPYLLKEILRDQWGYLNLVVSDGHALVDLHKYHGLTKNAKESAAVALKAGVQMNLGLTFRHLPKALKEGLVSAELLDDSLRAMLAVRFKLGDFNPPGTIPFDNIPMDIINCSEHRELAREAAVRSMVLLKNNNILPLGKDLSSLYIAGPQASNIDCLLGNYHGLNPEIPTILEGILEKVHPGTKVEYRPGTMLNVKSLSSQDWTDVAHDHDAVIAVMGLSNILEGEEGEAIGSVDMGDRRSLKLPENQLEYFKKLRSYGNKPLILVLTGGSLVIDPELYELADAVLFAWYPGEEGGRAVGDLIFGDAIPSGKLPVSFPASVDDLLPFEDYAMKGRTYRFAEKPMLFSFGFGLSYVKFKYDPIELNRKEMKAGENLECSVKVTNLGEVAAGEVVQVYLRYEDPFENKPNYTLVAFRRVRLEPGKPSRLDFIITPERMVSYDQAGKKIILKGRYGIYAGGCSPYPMIGAGQPELVQAGFEIT